MPARSLVLTAILPALAVATACSGGSVKQTVDVTATGDACTLSTTTIDAGKTRFRVTNSSGREAEAYVYDAAGKKVDEVEGIADGNARDLTLSPHAGRYVFACKPEG